MHEWSNEYNQKHLHECYEGDYLIINCLIDESKLSEKLAGLIADFQFEDKFWTNLIKVSEVVGDFAVPVGPDWNFIVFFTTSKNSSYICKLEKFFLSRNAEYNKI